MRRRRGTPVGGGRAAPSPLVQKRQTTLRRSRPGGLPCSRPCSGPLSARAATRRGASHPAAVLSLAVNLSLGHTHSGRSRPPVIPRAPAAAAGPPRMYRWGADDTCFIPVQARRPRVGGEAATGLLRRAAATAASDRGRQSWHRRRRQRTRVKRLQAPSPAVCPAPAAAAAAERGPGAARQPLPQLWSLLRLKDGP